MKNLLILSLVSGLLLLGCKKEEVHIEEVYFSAVIDGEMVTAESIFAEEVDAGSSPWYSGLVVMNIEATFVDLDVKELGFYFLRKPPAPYEGIYYNTAGLGQEFGIGAIPADSSSVSFLPAGGTLTIEDFDEANRWIKGSFDIKIENAQNDTLVINDGRFSVYYE